MEKLGKVQTKDYIAKILKKEIIEGNITSDDELRQETLAEMLGVSRMPIREALQILIHDGFAKRLPNRHIRAITLGKEQISEIVRVFSMFEVEIIKTGIEKNTDFTRVTELRNQINNFSGSKLPSDYEIQLHTLILLLCKNSYLQGFYKRMLDGYIRYLIEKFELPDSRKHITGIADAIIDGNKTKIKNAINRYYEEYIKNFMNR